MKKTVIALAAAAMTAPLAANAETDWFGFSQIWAMSGDNDATDTNDGLRFGADRVRIGYKASEGDAFAKLQLDFNRPTAGGDDSAIGVNEVIKDAVVGYKLAPAAKISTGVFKTPVGMDFTTPGKKLDITKRGMEKGLALERAAGAMVSGDFDSGFGYDVGAFNPTGRSSAVDGGNNGEDSAYAGRLRYDMDNLHLQAGTGTSENASGGAIGNEGEDYTVTNFAAKYTMDPLTLKFEHMAGENVSGEDGHDENVTYVHGGFMLNDSTELVARHYMGSNEQEGVDDTDLTNTWLGANFFLNDAARIQVNYVMAGGDTEGDYNGGAGGFHAHDDTLLTQFQYSF